MRMRSHLPTADDPLRTFAIQVDDYQISRLAYARPKIVMSSQSIFRTFETFAPLAVRSKSLKGGIGLHEVIGLAARYPPTRYE
jgi:hypothetical protein